MKILVVITALMTAVSAGCLYAFSGFVMQGLQRLDPAEGVRAMQAINVTAVRPPFMLVFTGSALLCAAVVVAALVSRGPATGWLIGGAALYLLGTFVLTIGYHVPRNDALAALDADAPGTATAWSTYLTEWVRMNHVRTAAAVAAAASFVVGALRA